ncbi:MAG: thermonuclease family protein [Clostridiales bacterium]|nr:thermonuclease family protein [Clostridiales bacterium]
MKKFKTLFIAILAIVVLVLCAACGGGDSGSSSTTQTGKKEFVDYASTVKLDFDSDTKKQEVTVRTYIDGDTTHFNPKSDSTVTGYNSADFASTDGYIKARYIAINTPENTGKIEPWGGAAAKYVQNKLANAQSIVVESDDNKWNIDSSGSFRYVVWVWYKPQGANEYHNLNLEVLQEGLALGSSVFNNRYGQAALNAMSQARDLKFYVHSDDRDPDFPYGEATPVTLKELRCNVEDYNGKKVKVEGIVTSEFSNSVYIQDYDAELGIYFGFSVYYGYQSGAILDVLSIGNRVSVVGVVSYWQAGGTYQISGVSHNEYDPELSSNSNIISKDNELVFAEVSAKNIVDGKLTVVFEKDKVDEDGNVVKDENGDVITETVQKEIVYGEAVMSTSVTVKNLTVVDTYTTKTGASAGAISLTCESEDGATIVVRTEVLKDENGQVIKEDKYAGKTITVKGIVDYYKQEGHEEGNYQVKVYHADYIEVLD